MCSSWTKSEFSFYRVRNGNWALQPPLGWLTYFDWQIWSFHVATTFFHTIWLTWQRDSPAGMELPQPCTVPIYTHNHFGIPPQWIFPGGEQKQPERRAPAASFGRRQILPDSGDTSLSTWLSRSGDGWLYMGKSIWNMCFLECVFCVLPAARDREWSFNICVCVDFSIYGILLTGGRPGWMRFFSDWYMWCGYFYIRKVEWRNKMKWNMDERWSQYWRLESAAHDRVSSFSCGALLPLCQPALFGTFYSCEGWLWGSFSMGWFRLRSGLLAWHDLNELFYVNGSDVCPRRYVCSGFDRRYMEFNYEVVRGNA